MLTRVLGSGQGDGDVTTRGLPPGLSEDIDATEDDYTASTEPEITRDDSVSSVAPSPAPDAAVAPESEDYFFQDYFGVCPICTCQLTPVLSNFQPETTINDSSRTGNIS